MMMQQSSPLHPSSHWQPTGRPSSATWQSECEAVGVGAHVGVRRGGCDAEEEVRGRGEEEEHRGHRHRQAAHRDQPPARAHRLRAVDCLRIERAAAAVRSGGGDTSKVSLQDATRCVIFFDMSRKAIAPAIATTNHAIGRDDDAM